MFRNITGSDLRSLKNTTVIIPSVSVGNVSQSVADLIIVKTSAKKIGVLWHDAFIPYIGSSSFISQNDKKSKTLTCSVEAYLASEHNVIIFQIRSPYSNSNKVKDFVKKLVDLIESWEVSRVIILSGMYDHCRLPCDLDDREISQFQYIISPEFGFDWQSKLKDLGWKHYLQGPRMKEVSGSDPYCLKHVGAGFTNCLFEECIKKKLPAAALLVFTNDEFGNATAINSFTRVNKLLHCINDEKI